MSSISDALKRAQQERDRLRDPGASSKDGATAETDASLASVVLRKAAGGVPVDLPGAAVLPAIAPTPLADAMRNAPVAPPAAVVARQKIAETIVEDYGSKRKLNLPQSMVVYHQRAGAAAEQYRKIRDALMAENAKRERQILVVTSAARGEGKTVTVLNLGLSLAEIRANRVLLVDGALQSGGAGGAGHQSLSDLLKLRMEPGLGELLLDAEEGVEEFIKATPWHNLFVLPSGAKTTASAAAHLLQSQNLGSVFRRLRASFDWVLVDSPAALGLPDAGLLSRAADGIILAAALHHTPEQKIQMTIRRLKSMNLAVKSVILTRG